MEVNSKNSPSPITAPGSVPSQAGGPVSVRKVDELRRAVDDRLVAPVARGTAGSGGTCSGHRQESLPIYPSLAFSCGPPGYVCMLIAEKGNRR